MSTTTRKYYEDHEIVEGAPATYFVGSDRYAMVVIWVDRFKTGKRAGLVKAIDVAFTNPDGTADLRESNMWTADEHGIQRSTRVKRFISKTRRQCRIHTEPSTYCYSCERAGKVYYQQPDSWSGQLVVGFAENYRDPSF